MSDVWVLSLNDMRGSHFEVWTPMAYAESREALLRFLERERVEVYVESTGMPATSPATDPTSSFDYQCNPTRWSKSHRKGGPLEWYNRPFPGNEDAHMFGPFPEVTDVMRAKLYHVSESGE